jgi:hypothetical protein
MDGITQEELMKNLILLCINQRKKVETGYSFFSSDMKEEAKKS